MFTPSFITDIIIFLLMAIIGVLLIKSSNIIWELFDRGIYNSTRPSFLELHRAQLASKDEGDIKKIKRAKRYLIEAIIVFIILAILMGSRVAHII